METPICKPALSGWVLVNSDGAALNQASVWDSVETCYTMLVMMVYQPIQDPAALDGVLFI